MPGLDLFADILVIAIKFVGREIGPEGLVVIADEAFQLVAAMRVDISMGNIGDIRLEVPVGILVVFIDLVGEDRADPEIVLFGGFLALEQFVILDQGLDVGDTEDRRELPGMGLAVMVFNGNYKD